MINGDELKRLYALDTIPYGEGSYLTATKDGREFLFSLCYELMTRIQSRNSNAIPSDSSIEDNYYSQLYNMIRENIDQYQEKYINELRKKFGLSLDDVAANSFDVSLERLKQMALYLDQEIEKKYLESYGPNSLNSPRFNDTLRNAASEGLEYAIDYYDDYDLSYDVETNKINDLIECMVGELSHVFSTLSSEFFTDIAEMDYTLQDEIDATREENAVHYNIDELMNNFDNALWAARGSDNTEDYQKLVMFIDQIMQEMHHHGPLLEYAWDYDNDESIQDISGLLQAKSSPFFVEWIKEEGLLPDDAVELLERYKLEGYPIQEYEYGDQYYKDPKFYFDWRRKNLPYDQWGSEGKNFEQLGYMNAAEVWDQSQRLMRQRKELEDYYKERGEPIPFSIYNDYDISRLRDMEEWSNKYLGNKMPVFRFSSKLLKIANKIDIMASDLSDGIDRLVNEYVV